MSEGNYPKSLPRSTPEEEGIPSQNILAFLDALEAGKFNLHSFMLVRHGKVISEGWWSPYDRECKQTIYSLSKSFTSTAVGFAVTEGLFNVNDKVISFFPDDLPKNISDNLAAMRVKDLLTMSTGHAIDSTLMILPQGLVNWAEAILSMSVDYTPGSHFLYNSGASYLLACIVQKTAGQTLVDYLTPRFFEPLAIHEINWETCPRGINAGGWGLSIGTEDLAKFGLFYTQKGNWGGKQLLAAKWVEEATSAQVNNDTEERAKDTIDWKVGYGYQFWRCQHGAYRADGAYGQFCVVMPEQEACLVITSETQDMQGILNQTWEYLLPAMKKAACPPNPEMLDILREKTDSLQILPPAATPLPPGAAGISGSRFSIKENEADIRTVALTFEGDAGHFRLWDGQGEHQMECGNGVWKHNETQMPMMQPSMFDRLFNRKITIPVKVAAHAEWKDPQTYSMTWQYLETPHSNQVICKFLGEEIQIDVTSSITDPNNPLLMGKGKRFTGKVETSGMT